MSRIKYPVRKRHRELSLRQLKKHLTFAYMYGKSGEEVERDLLKTFPDANEKLRGAFERYKQKLAELKTNKL